MPCPVRVDTRTHARTPHPASCRVRCLRSPCRSARSRSRVLPDTSLLSPARSPSPGTAPVVLFTITSPYFVLFLLFVPPGVVAPGCIAQCHSYIAVVQCRWFPVHESARRDGRGTKCRIHCCFFTSGPILYSRGSRGTGQPSSCIMLLLIMINIRISHEDGRIARLSIVVGAGGVML